MNHQAGVNRNRTNPHPGVQRLRQCQSPAEMGPSGRRRGRTGGMPAPIRAELAERWHRPGLAVARCRPENIPPSVPRRNDSLPSHSPPARAPRRHDKDIPPTTTAKSRRSWRCPYRTSSTEALSSSWLVPMAGDGEGPHAGVAGKVACAAWIRRPSGGPAVSSSRSLLVVYGRGPTASSPPFLDLLAFDTRACELASEPLLRVVMGEEGADADTPRAIAVHPAGDEFICATAKGCRLFKLVYDDFSINLVSKDSPPLQSVGPQTCLAFSTDGTKFAIGGEDGHLRIFHWPSLSVLLDEPKAHKSFRDMDISLDSVFLVSTSTDGSARIWKIDEGAPLVNLTRSSDERIECCRFSRDGKKPFLFCTLVKGNDIVTMVLNISNWKRIGYKRLLRKPISTLSVSLDGKYLALGSRDGDCCVADVQKMQVSHLIKKVHLGSPVSSIEFCPTERIVISTSHQWGAEITKLDVPADWRVWQIWLVFLSLFVASVILFYTFFKHTNLV